MPHSLPHHHLDFSGVVVRGGGQHKNLLIPGREGLDVAPPDWPVELFPGSLNVKLHNLQQGFASFHKGKVNKRLTLKWLDRDDYDPCFIIPQFLIGNNTLQPKWGKPRRGTAKLWRAILRREDKSQPCWVMRRIGSHMLDTLELISDKALRQELNLSSLSPSPVTLSLYLGSPPPHVP